MRLFGVIRKNIYKEPHTRKRVKHTSPATINFSIFRSTSPRGAVPLEKIKTKGKIMANIFDIFKEISTDRQSKANAPITHLIVGLGNPGDKYYNTRHNAGFLMMDYLSQRIGVSVDRVKFKALVGEAEIAGKRVLLLKPQTLMNASGLAVREAAAFYKIAPENILVFSDDISLDVGKVRLRMKGSDGGQKGLRSITTQINTDQFPRIHFGVGAKPHPDYDLADWVLSEFSKDEQTTIFSCFARAYDGVCRYLSGDSEGAVRICNAKGETNT